jgi:hypothetical protein
VVAEAWTAASTGRLGLLGHEPGLDELGEVLADRVVVQPGARRELGDGERPGRAGDPSEDVVPRRNGERSCFVLDATIGGRRAVTRSAPSLA